MNLLLNSLTNFLSGVAWAETAATSSALADKLPAAAQANPFPADSAAHKTWEKFSARFEELKAKGVRAEPGEPDYNKPLAPTFHSFRIFGETRVELDKGTLLLEQKEIPGAIGNYVVAVASGPKIHVSSFVMDLIKKRAAISRDPNFRPDLAPEALNRIYMAARSIEHTADLLPEDFMKPGDPPGMFLALKFAIYDRLVVPLLAHERLHTAQHSAFLKRGGVALSAQELAALDSAVQLHPTANEFGERDAQARARVPQTERLARFFISLSMQIEREAQAYAIDGSGDRPLKEVIWGSVKQALASVEPQAARVNGPDNIEKRMLTERIKTFEDMQAWCAAFKELDPQEIIELTSA